MKKRLTRILAVVGFLLAIGAIGAMQYFDFGKPKAKTEEAADAVADAAAAAIEWAHDRAERSVEVVTLVGQGPSVITVRTLLTMRGSTHLSAVCATLPRIHDTITVMLFDRLRTEVAAGRGINEVQLASLEDPLKDLLNRTYEFPTVERIRLTPGNAAMGDAGCTDKNARREKPKKAQESAHH